MAWVFDGQNGGELRLYRDLQLVWQRSGLGTVSAGNGPRTEALVFGGDSFYGRMSDIKAFKSALSVDQIRMFLPTMPKIDSVPAEDREALSDMLLAQVASKALFNLPLTDCAGPVAGDIFSFFTGSNVGTVPYAIGSARITQPSPLWIFRSKVHDNDGDGIVSVWDNCPDKANVDQQDWNSNGVGDACDPCPQCCVASSFSDSSYLTLNGLSSTLDPYSFTADLWLYTTFEPRRASLISKEGLITVGLNSRNELRMGVWISGVRHWFSSGVVPAPGRWVHVAVSRNATRFALLYRFETVLSLDLEDVDPPLSSGLTDGWVVGQGLRGRLDNLRLWTSTLGGAQLLEASSGQGNSHGSLHLANHYTFDSCGKRPELDAAGSSQLQIVGQEVTFTAADEHTHLIVPTLFDTMCLYQGVLVPCAEINEPTPTPTPTPTPAPKRKLEEVVFNFKGLLQVQQQDIRFEPTWQEKARPVPCKAASAATSSICSKGR